MEDPSFIGELLLLIAMAALGAAIFERLRLPSIAGFLVMGAVVGPGGLGLVDDPDRVRELAEFGVVFLLFEIALELPVERVQRLWQRAALAGGTQIGATIALVTVATLSFGVGLPSALVMGGIVAMSSTALVMRVLSERGEIDAPQGQISVGILLVQDLCIVPLLLGIPLLAAEGETNTLAALASLGRALAALVVFFVAARFLLPRLLERAMATGSRELFTLLAFLVVIGSAWVAEEIGLTLAVGAFVGGLVLSASPYSHQLFAEVVPLRGVLLGLFFTAVGMLLDPRVALEGWSAVLLYLVGVVVLKAGVVAALVTGVLRQGPRLGIIAGLGLAQTGEFSFVLAGVALEAGLLAPVLHQVFVAGSIASLIATPFLVRAAPYLAGWVAGPGSEEDAPASAEGPEGHVVLLGFGMGGQSLARVLRARGVEYRGAEANPATVQDLNRRGEPVVFGDVTRRGLLERVGVPSARLVVVSISDPVATREVVRLVREMNPTAPIEVRTRFVADVDVLSQLGASQVVAEEFESTLALIQNTLGHFGIPDDAIALFSQGLREEGYEPLRTPELALDPWIGELLDTVSSQWLEVEQEMAEDETIEGLAIRERTGCSVLAVEHGGETLPNPLPGQRVARGDRLLAFGLPTQVEALRGLVCQVADDA